MNIIVNDNTPAFVSFVEGCVATTRAHFERMGYTRQPLPTFTVSFGNRYARIMRDGSAHAFIDRTTGDVLKPASWKAPAKHARGNIFDAHNGLGSMGEYGPAYLR